VRLLPRHLAVFASLGAALALLGTEERSASADAPGASTVELEIAVGNTRGRVLCAVYERSGWLRRPVKGSASSIQGRTATCRFAGLKPGTYAAGAFQDENLNGRLDRSWTGAPKEPWCVSREVRGTFSAPSFESASFALSEGTVRLRCRAR